MIKHVSGEVQMVCRQVRKRFFVLSRPNRSAEISVTERAAAERHLQTCSRCALEYRLFSLQRAALDAAATSEEFTADENFLRGLRARIARGPEPARLRPADESWTAALLLTARQLIPAMAVLLLLILGATLFGGSNGSGTSQAAIRPRERVMFSDMYDYPAPTRDDVLETLVALEEK